MSSGNIGVRRTSRDDETSDTEMRCNDTDIRRGGNELYGKRRRKSGISGIQKSENEDY